MKPEEPERDSKQCLTGTAASARVAGLNDNVDFFGRQLHVQTENIGVPTARIVTQVFSGGRVLLSRKSDCPPEIPFRENTASIQEMMRTQHMSVMKELSDKQRTIDRNHGISGNSHDQHRQS